MSETISITEMIQINGSSDLVNGPEWLRQHVGHSYTGFVITGGATYDFGNWVCLMSSGAVAVYTDAFIQMLANSRDAFVKAGLWRADVEAEISDWCYQFITAFKEGLPLIYVKPDFDGGDDLCEIGVLERAPHRDNMTGSVDAARTWVIIASEYISGKVVDGIRLSVLLKKLKDLGIEYTLGARGPEQA